MRLYSLIISATAFAASADAEQITQTDLRHLPDAQVYVLGEFHDSAIQHQNQATAVEALAPKALVFEMLSPEQIEKITPADRLDQTLFDAATSWSSSGWPDLSLYWPIFEAAPTAPIYGAWVQRDALREAFSNGAAEVFGPEAMRYGLTSPLPESEQSEREQQQFEAHCGAMPLEMMGGMVASQRLRDAQLAKVTLDALQEHGAPVAVITGNGHARTDWGMPVYVTRAAPEVDVLSIGQLESAPEGQPPYDLWLVTAPTDRGDPCEGFGQTQ